MIEPLASHRALRLESGRETQVEETLAEETAVALLFNGVPHVVMMCTPCDLEDFALGFALTEGIVASADELQLVDLVQREHGLAIHLSLPGARFDALQLRQRHLTGRSGCGLCGAETLEQAMQPVRRLDANVQVTAEDLGRGFARLADCPSCRGNGRGQP
jgi:formate dehydrogenase accessory protein FdhD